ncbi:MAG: hypothetical protein R2932_57500 [Caldilineaceae bacterium]
MRFMKYVSQAIIYLALISLLGLLAHTSVFGFTSESQQDFSLQSSAIFQGTGPSLSIGRADCCFW